MVSSLVVYSREQNSNLCTLLEKIEVECSSYHADSEEPSETPLVTSVDHVSARRSGSGLCQRGSAQSPTAGWVGFENKDWLHRYREQADKTTRALAAEAVHKARGREDARPGRQRRNERERSRLELVHKRQLIRRVGGVVVLRQKPFTAVSAQREQTAHRTICLKWRRESGATEATDSVAGNYISAQGEPVF